MMEAKHTFPLPSYSSIPAPAVAHTRAVNARPVSEGTTRAGAPWNG